MSDTCNAARAAKRLLAEAAEAASRLMIGDEKWAEMSEAERERKCTAFIGDCHQHLRNIIINAMAIAATAHLKEKLEDDLAEFSSFDRMSVDGMDLIRAIWKEMHPGQQYAKGKGREFHAWVRKHYPSAMFVPFENAKGSRQDMAFDGALAIFANRQMALDFLHGLVNVPRADNTLEKFLWRVMRCNEMTALLRVCTLFKLVITDSMRWLTGKALMLDDWSIVSASRVLELAEEAFIAIAADGRKLLDPTLDPFAEIKKQQPLYAQWRKERLRQSVKSPDGKTKHRVFERVLAEARSPESKGNKQAEPATIALAEKMATAALTAMHDAKRAIADKLSSQDGENAPAKRAAMHAATVGAHTANDRVVSSPTSAPTTTSATSSVARLSRTSPASPSRCATTTSSGRRSRGTTGGRARHRVRTRHRPAPASTTYLPPAAVAAAAGVAGLVLAQGGAEGTRRGEVGPRGARRSKARSA